MKKYAAFIFLTFFILGCATAANKKSLLDKAAVLKSEVDEKNKDILEKENRIKELENALSGAEVKIREKDVKIEQLKDKLKNFGVFE